jgi:hypothetical protein
MGGGLSFHKAKAVNHSELAMNSGGHKEIVINTFFIFAFFLFTLIIILL